MSNQQRAYLYAGIAIFFWSTIASAFKIGLQEIDLVQFLFFATWTSFLILLAINIYTGRLRNISGIGIKDLVFAALMGALNPFIYYLVLFKAYELLPAQVAQPLNMIWPIILVFLSVIMLGQKIRAISFVALFISFIGVYFISSQGNPCCFCCREFCDLVILLDTERQEVRRRNQTACPEFLFRFYIHKPAYGCAEQVSQFYTTWDWTRCLFRSI